MAPVTDNTPPGFNAAGLKPDIQTLADRRGNGEIDDADAEIELHEIGKRHKDSALARRLYGIAIKKLTAAPATGKARHTTEQPSEPDPAEQAAAYAAAYAKCSDLATDPKLVTRLLESVRRLGVAGDLRGVLCTILVANSRLLSTPGRMLRKGAAASGKNYVIDAVVKILPKDEYITLTAASAKAMFYSEQDFRHKLVIIPEAAAFASGSNNSHDDYALAIREFISSGCLNYATVQPDENGILRGVTITKEGPIAFIATTARENVEEELLTRLLVTVTDEGDQQTKAILEAAALRAEGKGPTPLSEAEIAILHAFQEWLRLGPRGVVVPFASAIAKNTDRRAIRIRRDFPQVIGLTQASALMHRAQRRLDDQGRIIAEMADYNIARAALADGLEELAHGDTATVDAVRAAVWKALGQARIAWWRDLMASSFRSVMCKRLAGNGRMDIVEQLAAARLTERGRSQTDTVRGCIDFVTAADPTIAVDALYTDAIAAARKDAHSPSSTSPTAVEMSTQRLSTMLGIGRHAGRVRLDNAIEAGAVVDVGAADKNRSRTAPKLLAPGVSVKPASDGRGRGSGAFPSLAVVAEAYAEKCMGVEGRPSGPSGQAGT